MKCVRFIVTGDLERAAIVPSISRLFPTQTYEGEAVEWLRPRKVHCATSNRLRQEEPPGKNMRDLARALVAEAWEGAGTEPADLVIALDDVELHNFAQEELICAHFRAAIDSEFERRGQSQRTEQRMRDRLRERCSFHLLRPMVEAYLFGDQHALHRAGCAPEVRPRLSRPDVEDFECCDDSWLPRCVAVNGRMASPPMPMPWWREERHAKHYLEQLVQRNDGFYDECAGGDLALAELDWKSVAGEERTITMMRSMFEDLADFFGITSPLGEAAKSPLTYPARSVNRATLMLRNL